MKSLLLSILSFFAASTLIAQCSNFVGQFPAATQSTTSNSLVNVTTCQFAGEYASYNVTAGETYTWTTCGDTDFDTQLTLWNAAHTVSYAYNDDDCGLQSTITWTATFTGTVDVLLSQYSCNSNSTCMTVQWACTTCGGGGGGGIIQSNGSTLACSGTFYDSGGSGGVYGANELTTYTICPDTPGSMVTIDFTTFNVEGGFDVLCIYDGMTTAAPTLGCYDNNVPLSGTVQATNPDGCLTFFFDSDGSVQYAGWAGAVSCTQPCQTVVANPTFNPAPAVDGVIYLCQGDVLQMNGAGVYPDNGTGYVQSDGTSTFEWSTQDGANQNGQNVNHTFNTQGAYLIELEITDIEGCTNTNDIDQYVYVSTTPVFAGTAGAPDPICLGDQATFTGVVTPVEFQKFCTPPNFPPLALPDGSGVSYQTSVNLDCYAPGQTLNNVNDLLSICVNMEHSYMGDLDIVIECPSGQQVILTDYPNGGGGTYLGIPVDNDATPNVQGTGFDYCWSPTATNGDWSANTGGTLPAGTYESEQSLAGLVGCDMNGDWTLIITDNLGSDNGFIFSWGINFNPSILPPAVTFTPNIVSESWLPDPSIVSGTNPIVVEPTATGPACYTYQVTDDFGCTYDTTVCITVTDGPVLDPVADVAACDSYTLPAISGTNLTAGVGYFSGPNGTGTSYSAGSVISTNMTPIYIYDPGVAGCDDEESFNITIDNTPPAINCPGNLIAVCSIAEQPPYSIFAQFTGAGGSASDDTNLDVNSFTLLSEVSNGNTCPEIVTRTYQIADACGHTATCQQLVTINDNINPTATAPANVNVQCAANIPAANPALIADEADNCGIQSVVHFSDVSDNNSCPETITRTYRITDLCGNFTDVTQLIIINDTQVPVFAAPPANLTVQCIGDVPAMTNLNWTDNCDGAGNVPGVDGALVGGSCGGTITRTWTYTDACGNTATTTQTITVNDTQVPVFAAPPANVTVECIADVPAMTNLNWTDNCDGAGNVLGVDGALMGGACGGTITRTWTYTDACGNTATATQTITVDDTTPPTGTAPANMSVQCMADVPAVNIIGITDEADNCSVPAVSHISDVQSGATCPITIDRTYRITDDCGNFIDVVQTITVNDNIAPTGTAPANVTVQCVADIPVADPLAITDEADNCTISPTVTFISDVSDNNTCPETIARTYEIEDECGNITTLVQTITVNDNIAPSGTAPANVTVQCMANVPAVNVLDITDEADNCSAPTVTHVSDVQSAGTCPITIDRTYQIADDCGNAILVVQTITVDDTTPPTGTAPANITVQCNADIPIADPLLITDEADNCSLPTVTHLSDASDGNTCPEVITRTYRITDDCGNITDVVQLITVDDTAPPTGTAPAAITVECTGDIPVADPLLITDETDNCTVNPVVNFVSDVSDGNTCPEIITRTYEIIDDCGNTTTVTQIITIDDTTPPTASNPPNISIPGGVAPAPDVNVVTDEADNCSVPVVAFVSDVSDGGNCPETITRTYSVTDDCGNQITVIQLIIIGDAILPTASNPTPINVECITDVPAPDPLVVTDESDNGGPPVVAWDNDLSDGNSCPETIVRTYSVTDDCGNVIFVTQNIVVNDVTPPTASNPAPINVECIADVPAADILVVTDEADNCGVPIVAFVGEVSDNNTCPETITRTYRITDDCGNFTDVTQTIIVNDITAPTGTAPANITVECAADVPVADPLLITDEADNCTAAPAVTHISDVSDGNTCPEVITRTYEIVDDCGNTTTVTQTITVDDTTLPTASNPANINVAGGVAPAPDPLVVTDEADNCSVPTVAFVSDVSDGNNCPETITRTYSVTDACGNQITVTQLIIIGDPFPPTGTAPADVTVECTADIPAADPLLITDEADNNGVPTVAFISDVSDNNTCPETITRTYSITDLCGNVTNVTQLITVNDITAPTATNPAPINVECIADVPAADVLVVTDEADNCTANPAVTHLGDVSDNNTCPETITRTYRITDDCGNFTDVTQTIIVNDITAPTGTAPANITVECAADVPVADPLLITDEADNCTAAPVVTHISDVSDGNTCPEVITRTYEIVDDCGNTTTVTQTITVDDTTLPTASNPASITIPGGPAPAPDPLVVTDEADNCTANPVVAFVSDVSDNNPCPETITRTYSVTDNCGNQITVTQNIIITDPILPTGTAPADVTVECIADVPAADPLLITDEADNNGVPTVAFVSDVSDNNTCPETITRTYSITDVCGNVVNVTQLIIVNDITAPTATNPANINVECIADVPAADVLVVTDEADNCTANPAVTHLGDVSDNNTCPETITRTYRITDDCGNFTDVTQTIIVNDITAPTGTAPANITVECIADVPVADPLLITDEADNCTANPAVNFVSDASDGNTCPEVITRTYEIVDDCGNTTTVTQTITVDDTTPPTASNPANITVPGGPAPAPDPLVVIDEADNCTANPVVAFVSDVSDGNLCPETITRTYSVTDNCGNQITVTQDIIITDPINPTGTAPANVTVECIADVPAADPLLITDEADNNGVPTVAFVSDVSDGNSCPETITRTYSITDVCNNQILVTQTITVNDITAPTGTAPATVNVECIADVPAADPLLITDEADNCTVNPTVVHLGDVSDNNTCPETITRTYRITDDCGNFTDVTQTITVNDITAPTGTAPATVNVQCIADVPVADPLLITNEADNCTANPTVIHLGDVSDGNSCPETITRTYRITDDCGNFTDVTQSIIVNDLIPPTASNPANITVYCASDVPVADITVVTDEADNCTAAPVVAHVSDVSDGNTCNGETITRTYSVTDDCGNQILVTQQIIIDVVTPTVNAGIDQNVCEGTAVTLSASNNPSTASISWDNGVVDGVSFTQVVGTTTYTVVASECNGECFVADQVDVTVNPLPVVAFDGDVLSGCAPLTVNFTNYSTDQFDCVWDFGDGNTAAGCGPLSNTYQNAGTYDVTLTVTSSEGCTSSMTITDYVNVVPYPQAYFSFTPDVLDVNNTEVVFSNQSLNADSYIWNFGDLSANSTEENPDHTYPNVGNMEYTITLNASSNGGACVDQISATIYVQDILIYYVPNTFTPDGNSINNTFKPIFTSGYDYYDYHLTIFNRWGEVIFESFNSDYGWNGHYGDGGLVEDGTYIWQIEFGETMSDKRNKQRGHVTVLK